jgi:hypothetical protein
MIHTLLEDVLEDHDRVFTLLSNVTNVIHVSYPVDDELEHLRKGKDITRWAGRDVISIAVVAERKPFLGAKTFWFASKSKKVMEGSLFFESIEVLQLPYVSNEVNTGYHGSQHHC